ncbi:MAG: cell division protein ZapA [Hyphomicrobium sp.]
MAHVTLNLNGRSYTIGCDADEEQRLQELGQILRSKLDGVVREFGQVGEARALLLAALMIADELIDTRAERDTAASTAAAAVLREMAERARSLQPPDQVRDAPIEFPLAPEADPVAPEATSEETDRPTAADDRPAPDSGALRDATEPAFRRATPAQLTQRAKARGG